jgi:hypothetical protein
VQALPAEKHLARPCPPPHRKPVKQSCGQSRRGPMALSGAPGGISKRLRRGVIDRRVIGAFVFDRRLGGHVPWRRRLAAAAADYWSERTGALFEAAPYHKHKDPLDRVLGYIDFRRSILKGELAEFTCLVGTMVQEIYASNPAIRDACDASISGHAAKVEDDIAEAMRLYGIRATWSAKSLALYITPTFNSLASPAALTGSQSSPRGSTRG